MEQATMIRTTDGRYWLDHIGKDGRRRSSYLGDVGPSATVEAWCLGHGIEFRQVGHASACADRTRRQPSSGRNQRTVVASKVACPA